MTAAAKGGGTPPPSDRLMSAKEAADYLGISLKRLFAFCNDGSLRHLRLADTKAGVLRFRRLWLDSWAEAKATGGSSRAAIHTPATTSNPRCRYWLTALDDRILRRLVTADTLESVFEAAASREEQRLFIYDRRDGFLVVWAGTPEDARNPKWTTLCAACGHAGLEHWTHASTFGVGACRHPECTCKEFRR